jgi:hypothetical protein
MAQCGCSKKRQKRKKAKKTRFPHAPIQRGVPGLSWVWYEKTRVSFSVLSLQYVCPEPAFGKMIIVRLV